MKLPKNAIELSSLIILIAYILLFPFGQILKFPLIIGSYSFSFNLSDIIILTAIPLFFLSKIFKPKYIISILDFFYIAIFSLLLSLSFLPLENVLYGSFYLLRLFSFLALSVITLNLIKSKLIQSSFLRSSLIAVLVVAGLIGWVQYLFLPDLVDLKYLGWDDHLYRLAGTYLDPAFTGILMSLGAILSFSLYFFEKKFSLLLLTAFFVLTVLFTYSRASYLALTLGFLIFFYLRGGGFVNKFLPLLLGIVVSVLLLPRMAGVGTRLERTHSIYAKLTNYRESITIVKEYPLFGVGFNNLCPVRNRMFADSFDSHACYGSDSSILFILATTGLVGFLVFLGIVYKLCSYYEKNTYSIIVISSLSALLVHSLFVQSAFYSFVLGHFALLIPALSEAKGSKKH